MSMEIDEIDQRILRTLQAEGRLSNQELAERVGLSPSPCLRRMRRLEREGVIRGYAAVVDESRYGLPVTVFARIRLARHGEAEVAAFEAAVRAAPDILECYVITGDCDYILRVAVGSLAAYETFMRRRLHRIPGIASIDTSFAFGEVKRMTAFPALPR